MLPAVVGRACYQIERELSVSACTIEREDFLVLLAARIGGASEAWHAAAAPTAELLLHGRSHRETAAAAAAAPPAQVASLKALGLNIRRAKLGTQDGSEGAGQEHKFYVTDGRTSEKVLCSGGGCSEVAVVVQLVVRCGAGRCAVVVRPLPSTTCSGQLAVQRSLPAVLVVT